MPLETNNQGSIGSAITPVVNRARFLHRFRGFLSEIGREIPNLDTSPYIKSPYINDSGIAAVPAQLQVTSLLNLNLAKMHHQQAVSQNIRTWSFALVGVFLGATKLFGDQTFHSLIGVATIELILFVVLLREIDWHRMFWRYRDRVRVCEGYLLGTLSKEDCFEQYCRARDRTRSELLKGAFSPRQLLTNRSDFVEVYLMIAVLIVYILRLQRYW